MFTNAHRASDFEKYSGLRPTKGRKTLNGLHPF